MLTRHERATRERLSTATANAAVADLLARLDEMLDDASLHQGRPVLLDTLMARLAPAVRAQGWVDLLRLCLVWGPTAGPGRQVEGGLLADPARAEVQTLAPEALVPLLQDVRRDIRLAALALLSGRHGPAGNPEPALETPDGGSPERDGPLSPAMTT